MASSAKDAPLVEEKDAELVPFNGAQGPITRKGMFLNPTPSKPPTTRPNAAPFAAARGEPNYHPQFRWWADPQPQWDQWVEKLRPKYSHLWQKSGIFYAVMVSKHRFRRDPAALLAAARFWCKETNSFLFPWAEATVTLEDVMILGGLSVLGKPVRVKEPVTDVVGHMVIKMGAELQRNCLKGEHTAWLRHYLEKGKGDEIEHIVFLSLWLSRFVLVEANGKAIPEAVFQVAVRLAMGTRIALAPAVLASIYRDLGVVKEHLRNKSEGVLAVWSPMNIVQMWLWERFPALRPNSKSVLGPDMPRAMRWSMTGKTMDLSSIMAVLASPEGFWWRPYAVEELVHEHRPFFYMNEGGWFVSDVTKDEELQSFAQCLRACELVGLDCIEQYLPHRVAMQFALDQQVPKSVPRANSTWEVAWKTYDMSSMSVELYVPPRLFESAATIKYTNWWRNIRRWDMAAGKKKRAGQNLPKNKKKKAKVFTGTELSARQTLRPHAIKTEDICSKSQEQQTCTMKPPHTELSLPLESPEKMNQSLYAAGRVESVSEKQQKADLEPLSVDGKGIVEVVEKTNSGEFHHDFTAIEKSREANEKQQDEEFRPELQVCSMKPPHTELSLPLESPKKTNQSLDAAGRVESVSEKQQKADLALLSVNDKGIIEVVKKTNSGEFHHDFTVIEKSREANEKQQDEEFRPEPDPFNEDRITEVAKKIKELDRDLTVTESKEEIKKQQEEFWPEPVSPNVEQITEVVKKIKLLNQNLTTTDESKEENEKQRLKFQPEPLCISDLGVMKCSLKTNTGVDNEQTAAKKPEAELKRAETEAIEERDSARRKELECEPKRKREETSEIDERDSARRKELKREAKHKSEETKVIEVTKAIEQTVQIDLARKNDLHCESKRQTEKRIVIDPAKELKRDRRISELKGEIASILAQIRYWESVAEEQELIPSSP